MKLNLLLCSISKSSLWSSFLEHCRKANRDIFRQGRVVGGRLHYLHFVSFHQQGDHEGQWSLLSRCSTLIDFSDLTMPGSQIMDDRENDGCFLIPCLADTWINTVYRKHAGGYQRVSWQCGSKPECETILLRALFCA